MGASFKRKMNVRPALEVLEDRCLPALFPAVLPLSGLNGGNGFALDGNTNFDYAGHSVRGAGDVNGDGFADVIIGARGGGNNGQAYVIFGTSQGFPPSLDFSSLNGSNGFILDGVNNNDDAGYSVAGAGDVNGDAFDDLIVGAPFDNAGGSSRGQAYVVFGHGGPFAASLALSTLTGSNGFTLNGISDSDRAGSSVAGVGDFNGDGFDDVIVGAIAADAGGSDRGQAYVVFGHSGAFAASLDLSDLTGGNGFTLNGIGDDDRAGSAVSGAGDINGDTFADLIVGAFLADVGGSYRGQAYVVFGTDGALPISLDLSALNGSNGFALNGVDDDDNAGFDVAGAGDVNGDGFDDVIVGAPVAGASARGQAYVIFGHSGAFALSLNLSALTGGNGFALNGSNNGDEAGYAVAGAGDVNGDGFDDLIVGAPFAATSQGNIVFGHGGTFAASLALSSLNGSNGFTLNAISSLDRCAARVASAGDVNGDGLADLVVVAPFADLGGTKRGQAYVVFGRQALTAVSPDKGSGPLVRIFQPDGTPLFDMLPYPATFNGGVRVAVGDVTGDGQPDIITVPGPGMFAQVRILDGRTRQFALGLAGGFAGYAPDYLQGVSIAVGDTDGDGVAEIALAPDKGPRKVRIFSGTGQLQNSFFPYGAAFTGGVRVAVGDTEGTAAAEIITVKASGGATLRVFTEAGTQLHQFNVAGNFVAVGNVDGDPQAEIIVGANAGQVGRVRTYNGTTGALEATLIPYEAGFLGGIRVGVGDANGDGRLDILTAPGKGRAPEVKFFDPLVPLTAIDSFFAYDLDYKSGLFVVGT